jgi:protein transport protein DSL1/ZW10
MKGAQSLLQQEDAEGFIDAAVSRVRAMAVTWESILARSAWCQAVGSLVDAIATKIINDIMEMPSIGSDEAFNIANLIARIVTLDDLFLPSRVQGGTQPLATADEVPMTAQYAASWLRLQYLSEVLQSNLNELRYLWMEGELSLYFRLDEVVDLINASFEANARSREVVKEITANPKPRIEAHGW